MISAREELTVV